MMRTEQEENFAEGDLLGLGHLGHQDVGVVAELAVSLNPVIRVMLKRTDLQAAADVNREYGDRRAVGDIVVKLCRR